MLGQIKVHGQAKCSEYVAGVATGLQPLTLHTRGPRRAGVTRPAPSGCPQVTEWARSAAPLWHCLSLTSLHRCIRTLLRPSVSCRQRACGPPRTAATEVAHNSTAVTQLSARLLACADERTADLLDKMTLEEKIVQTYAPYSVFDVEKFHATSIGML